MSLPSTYPEGHVFIEKTREVHQHGGPEWEFGTCLWSPTTSKDGKNIYGLMLEPKPGDLIIHDYDCSPPGRSKGFYFVGTSLVRAAARISNVLPSILGNWSFAKEVYRIDLDSYTPFKSPLLVDDFLAMYLQDIIEELPNKEGQHYPFCYDRGLRHAQGKYLTIPSPLLYDLLIEELGAGESLVLGEPGSVSADDKRAAREGAEVTREVTYFLRNRALAERIKKERGYTCEVCGFSPQREFGEGFIQTALECHHHKPVAVVRQEILTSDSDVSVVCANCHRFIHTRRPTPLAISEARKIRKRSV